MRIAFMTMVLLKAERASPAVAGFMERIAGAFAAAEALPGFVDRARVDPATGLYNWGVRGVPSTFPVPDPGDRLAHTLSVWRDLESVAQYSYRGLHAEAVKRRGDWCVPPTWPTYYAWWIADDAWPTWEEGYRRFDRIHRHGPTAEAFDFRRPYTADGTPTTLKRSAT
ncbi:MAG: DUF3291 domain-containing protein [Proteobacteria bacterium]|nr:DUF3291 domain-containing protein [Pseudomonadota bacterium]